MKLGYDERGRGGRVAVGLMVGEGLLLASSVWNDGGRVGHRLGCG